MDAAAAFRDLVQRFGEERVANAVLEKWLSDSAGMAGFYRLAAMIKLYDDGARLNHFKDEDRFDNNAPADSYWQPRDSRSIASRKREEKFRREGKPERG